MEYKKTFLSLLVKFKWVLVFALVVALVAGIFSWQRGDRYRVSVALVVSRMGTQQATDYKYDSYYALKASDEFSDTIAGWFKTPEMTVAIYKKAGLSYGNPSLGSLARRFDAAKIAPNIVEVRFGAKSEAEANALAQGVNNAIQEKAYLISAASWQGISFATMGSEPVVVKSDYLIWLNALAGLLVGLVVGLFGRAAKDFF